MTVDLAKVRQQVTQGVQELLKVANLHAGDTCIRHFDE